jgi:CRP/FNR family transcriptional regulator, nitrogen fixation regulation protein
MGPRGCCRLLVAASRVQKIASSREKSMFVNVNAHPGSRPQVLGELGELSRAQASLIEFKYDKGTEIYGESEPADYIYQIVDGAVRSYKLLSDGRRQIGAFHLVGDIFGLENGAVHRFTTEAIVDTTVRLMKRCSLEQVAESNALVALDLLHMTTSNLQHAEDHMLLLGRKTSVERVAAFLLEMDRRLTGAGVMVLPMSRRDIADYLGLTLETVSRALSDLHGRGMLGFLGQTQRQIVLLDRVRLAELDL